MRLVTEEWPGLIDNNPSGPEGVLWELTRSTLEDMGYSVELEFMPWKRALQLVRLGQRDGIIGIGFNRERAEIYRFPDHPLLLSRTVVVSPAGSGFDFQGIESLSGLQVGVSPGYSYSQEIRESTNFDKVDMPSIQAGLGMLLLGRIDVMLANYHAAVSQAVELNITDQIEYSDKAISSGPVYLAFRPEMDQSVIDEFSRKLPQ
ncbi:substrate-binding periplasmic protein [Marinobacter confluentis]|uniref:substrate-binding periplasmic protein n=1 Tax=Marinobacter confluentis TaxID=1697557 RepID=UPI00143CC1B3|nr:transporter substrate-binding domain-containing protein [Marinobacter confluentis]